MESFVFALVGCWILSQAFAAADKTISANTPLLWVAPTIDQWKKSQLKDVVKTYLEAEWAKCSWDDSCSDDRLKIIPVYFWPSERVDLPCVMCELAFAFNGKIKRWGIAEDITEFLEDPQKGVLERRKWKQVQNTEWFDERKPRPPVSAEETDKLPYSYVAARDSSTLDEKEPPAFLQRDGKLSIIRASPVVQGVYFCYDESLGSTNVFYVVTAMVPPVSLANDYAFTDGCTDDDYIIPSFNWRFHFLPAVRNDPPEDCTNSPTKCQNKTYNEVTNTTRGDDVCDLEFCRKEIVNIADTSTNELHVAIELRWDEWTKCTGGVQRREAHCHLIRREGQVIPEDTSTAFAWLGHLNSLFDLDPYRKEGIRLYSSLLPSLIQGVPRLTGCRMKEEALLDNVYREIMLYTMGVQTEDGQKISRNTDYAFRLTNPFQACLGYERENADWELLVGTYMVESRKC